MRMLPPTVMVRSNRGNVAEHTLPNPLSHTLSTPFLSLSLDYFLMISVA